MDLDEVAAETPGEIARFSVGRDERGDHEHAVPLEPAGEVGDPPDVRVSLHLGEAGAREDVADAIAIEMLHLQSLAPELVEHRSAMVLLPAPESPVSHTTAGSISRRPNRIRFQIRS